MQKSIIPYEYGNQIKFDPNKPTHKIDEWALRINLMIQNSNYKLAWTSFSHTLICKEIPSKRIQSEIQNLCKQIGKGYIRIHQDIQIPQSIVNITITYIMVKPHIYKDVHYNYYDKRYTEPPSYSPQAMGIKWIRKYWEIEKSELLQSQKKMDVDT